jgi:hypothetical protein
LLIGAVVAALYLRKAQRSRVIATLSLSFVAFVACLAAFPILKMDAYKAPKELVAQGHLEQTDRDIRIASLYWFKPSTVFYAKREIRKLNDLEDVKYFLSIPRESYLLVAEPVWREIEGQLHLPTRIVAEHYDFYEDKKVLVISNWEVLPSQPLKLVLFDE